MLNDEANVGEVGYPGGDLPQSYRRTKAPERKRPGKKGRRRSRTIATRRLSKEELALAEELSVVEMICPYLARSAARVFDRVHMCPANTICTST